MTSKEMMQKSIEQHWQRIDYFKKLKSMQRSMPGTKIEMEFSPESKWPDYYLKDYEGNIIASIYTRGHFANHYFG